MMTTEPTNLHADLYAILGLDRYATQAEIAHAYRTLLRRHHPDTRTDGDPSQDAVSDAALQQILTAYAVLRDPDRRTDYDQRYTTRRSRPSITIAETGPGFVPLPDVEHRSAPDLFAGPLAGISKAPLTLASAGPVIAIFLVVTNHQYRPMTPLVGARDDVVSPKAGQPTACRRADVHRPSSAVAVGEGGALDPCSSRLVINSMMARRSSAEGSPHPGW